MRGEPLPPKPPAASADPPGVANHDLHTKLTKYMLENKIPERDYAKVLDQYMTEWVTL
jgi:hypothetical protein